MKNYHEKGDRQKYLATSCFVSTQAALSIGNDRYLGRISEQKFSKEQYWPV